jgi:predicted nucleic acid-binding protein
MAKKIICDTDVLIDYRDTSKPRHKNTKSIIETRIELDNVVISATTKMELMTGSFNKSNLKILINKLHRFNIVLFNPEITLKSFELLEKYALSHNLALPDSLIAASSLITGYNLYTYNIKDFKFIEGIKLFDI